MRVVLRTEVSLYTNKGRLINDRPFILSSSNKYNDKHSYFSILKSHYNALVSAWADIKELF